MKSDTQLPSWHMASLSVLGLVVTRNLLFLIESPSIKLTSVKGVVL